MLYDFNNADEKKKVSTPLNALCNHADSVETEVLADFCFRPPTENLGCLARYIKSSGEIDPVCIIRDTQMRLLVFAGGTVAEAEIELTKLPLRGRGQRRQREWTFSLPWEFLYLWWELSDNFGLSRLQVSTDADESQFWLILRGDSHYVRSGPLFADDLRIMEGVADFDVHANRVRRLASLNVAALEKICTDADLNATDFACVFDSEDEDYGTSHFSCPMVKMWQTGKQINASPLRLEDFVKGEDSNLDGERVCSLNRYWERDYWSMILPVYQLQKCLEYSDRRVWISSYKAQEQLLCIDVNHNFRFYIGDVEQHPFGDRPKFPISMYHAPRFAMDTALQCCDYTIQGTFPHPAIIYWEDIVVEWWELIDDIDSLEKDIAKNVASQLKIKLSDLPGQRVFL